MADHTLVPKLGGSLAESPEGAPRGVKERGFAELGLELLAYAVQSPTNLGMILRVAEAYCFAVSIFDPHRVLEAAEKRKTIEDFACGSLPRQSFTPLPDKDAVMRRRAGRRLIVTSVAAGGYPLTKLQFEAGDLVVLGNEYDGLPDDLLAEADVRLHIPMPDLWIPKPASWYPIDPNRTASVNRDGTPNLNVAMSAAIICYAAYSNWAARL